MTVSPVQAQFVKPLCGVFKRTPGADEKEYFRLLKEKLAGFDPVDLGAAADEIASSAETQTWPPLTVCIRTCQAAEARRLAAERQDAGTAEQGEGGRMPEDAAMRIIAAQDEAMGLAACDGDWILRLVEFVQEHKRLPVGREVDGVKAKANEVGMLIEEHLAAGGSAAIANLLVSAVHGKRKRIAERMKELLRLPVVGE